MYWRAPVTDVPTSDAGGGPAGHRPFGGGDGTGAGADRLQTAQTAHEVPVADGRTAPRSARRSTASGQLDVARRHSQACGCELEDDGPGRGRRAAEMLASVGHRPAAEGAHVPGRDVGVPHREVDRGGR